MCKGFMRICYLRICVCLGYQSLTMAGVVVGWTVGWLIRSTCTGITDVYVYMYAHYVCICVQTFPMLIAYLRDFIPN